MPINVSGSTSGNADKNLINPRLYKSYSESNIEKDIDMKNQFRIENLPDPISIRESASKLYVADKFNDPSITKNTEHFDFNNKNLDKVRFVKVNFYPAIGGYRTPKTYVDQSRDESTLVRNKKMTLTKNFKAIYNK